MSKNTHVNKGIRKILEIPQMYNLKGKIFGGENYRRNHAKNLQIKEGDKILDIGCGTSNILKYLPQNIEYHGIDMEEEYIKFCIEKYGHRASFYCERVGDYERKEWENYFDCINIHGLLHHLTDDDCNHILNLASIYVNDQGTVVTVDSVFHKNQNKIDKWFVSRDRGQNIKSPKEYINMASKFFDKVDHKIVNDHIRIPYSIFIMRMRKS